MRIFGITGLKGSGKSTAISYLASKGYPSFDADQGSRLVVDRKTEAGKEGFEKIYKAFGSTVLNSLGDLDRNALLRKIMLNPSDKEKIEAIVDPLVHKLFEKQMKAWKDTGVKLGFVEGSRLAEAGFEKLVAGLILVTADYDKRVSRLAKRDTMGKLELETILKLQDDHLMKIMCKIEWKNDKKPKDFEATIDQFVAQKLASQ